jgi:pimeloyl-ACP methyl ester carboxylesterase
MTRPRRQLGRLGVLAAFLMFSGCTNVALLFPSTDFRDSGGAVRRTMPFQKGILEAWTKPTANLAMSGRSQPSAYVLCFIGNGSRAEQVAQYEATVWLLEPVEIWAINYPGYGGSTGPADINSIGPAALAAYDFLAPRGRPIIVDGQSLGCVASLYVAARRPTVGAMLRSPPPLRQLIMGNYGWWNLWLLATPVALGVPDDLDSIANAKASHCPAVFIITGQDGTVPRKYQEEVESAYAGAKQVLVLPDADHNDPMHQDQLTRQRSMLHALWAGQKPTTAASGSWLDALRSPAKPTTVQSPP